MSITTKRGDGGETDLFNQSRVSKSDSRICALSALDELNSLLGIIGGLEKIQSDLFELGAIVANPSSKENMSAQLKELEEKSQRLEAQIPPLRNFILPDNQLHFARAICRRAECELVKVSEISGLPDNGISYLNRLSDYLFLLARSQNLKSEKKEVIWKKL